MADSEVTSCNFVNALFIYLFVSSVSIAKLSFSEALDHNTEQYTVKLRCFVRPLPVMVGGTSGLLYNDYMEGSGRPQ